MSIKKNRAVVVARATAPGFPQRLVAVYAGYHRHVFAFGSESERERYLVELVADGASAVESTMILTDDEASRAA